MLSNRWIPTAVVAALCALSTASAPCAPAPRPAADPEPKLIVVRSEFDAGKVIPGDPIRVDFPIRNDGTAPLTVLGVKKDCGCLVPSYDEQIEPGKTGHVRVTLRTSGYQGKVEKHVYLETDDPKLSSVTLTIKAVMPWAVEVAPSNEVLIPVAQGHAATSEVTLRTTDEEMLDVGSMESDAPFLTAEVVPGTAAAGREVKVRITVAADAPSETFEAQIRIVTGHPHLRQLALKVFGQPAVAVTVRPPRLAYGRVHPNEKGPIERLLTLTRTTGAFHIVKVEDSLGCLKIDVAPATDPSYGEIKITYVGGWKDEQTKGVLRITTDDPSRPVIEVPYTAEVW